MVKIEDLLKPLIPLSPWQVVAGGGLGSLFGLDMGEKIPVEKYLEDRDPPYPFRGEYYLFIECCWRLDEAACAFDPVTSWQESNEPDGPMLRGLHSLIGDPILSLSVSPPAGDLKITFGSGRRLTAFCDLTWKGTWDGEADGLTSNWSLFTPGRKVLCIGPGYRWIYTDVDFPAVDLLPEDPLWQSTFELSCIIP